MSKFLLIKIIGGFIAIAIVAGGISIWIKTHHSSVMVQEAQKILPARVNPLLSQSNKVYHFVYDDYVASNLLNDRDNVSYYQCYYKGGFIQNQQVKNNLRDDCKRLVKHIMQFAKTKGYFQTAKMSDWLDQDLLKKIYTEGRYFSDRFDQENPPEIKNIYHEYPLFKKDAELEQELQRQKEIKADIEAAKHLRETNKKYHEDY